MRAVPCRLVLPYQHLRAAVPDGLFLPRGHRRTALVYISGRLQRRTGPRFACGPLPPAGWLDLRLHRCCRGSAARRVAEAKAQSRPAAPHRQALPFAAQVCPPLEGQARAWHACRERRRGGPCGRNGSRPQHAVCVSRKLNPERPTRRCPHPLSIFLLVHNRARLGHPWSQTDRMVRVRAACLAPRFVSATSRWPCRAAKTFCRTSTPSLRVGTWSLSWAGRELASRQR